MPSTSDPKTTIASGPGPFIVGGGAGAANASITAHISDPTDAHDASSISYVSGPAWADGTTNPSTNIEAQVDKIITDLADTVGVGAAGANRIGINSYVDGTYGITYSATNVGARILELALADNIGYAAGPAWADATANGADSVGDTIDSIISALASTTAGTAKIGGAAIVNTSSTIPAGTLRSQLVALSLLSNLQWTAGTSWRDSTTNPAATAQARIDKIVTDLNLGPAGAGASGGDKIGLAQRTSWLGGRTNVGNVSVQAGIEKIIQDLALNASDTDDGAIRIGSAARQTLDAGSVGTQLDQIDDEFVRPDRAQNWTSTQTWAPVSDEAPMVEFFSAPPSDRKVLISVTATADYLLRVYSSGSTGKGLEITQNAQWVTNEWVADDTATPACLWWVGQATVPFFSMRTKTTTTVAWDNTEWDDNRLLLTNEAMQLLGDGAGSLQAQIVAEDGSLVFSDPNTATGGSNPPATTGHTNTLKAKNVLKVWGKITTGGGGPTLSDGFNVGALSYNGSNLRVVFANTLASAHFSGNVTAVGGAYIGAYDQLSASQTDIQLYNHDGSQIDLSSTIRTVMFQIYGVQS